MLKSALRSSVALGASNNGRQNVSYFRRSLTVAASGETDVRAQLLSELKSAMKSKDTVKSTTIRSVLSEIYAADKARPEPAPSSAIVSILRKAALRRTDTAAEYEKASRPDLADKEKREAELLQVFVPPLLPEADIDRALREVLFEQNIPTGEGSSRKALGALFKAFYAKVDRSFVDTELVRVKAEALLAASTQSS